MRIGILGAGRIGSNLAGLLVRAGHEVMISYARDPARLEQRATAIGCRAGSVGDVARFGPVVVLSVPWSTIDAVLAEAGSLQGTVVVDTTNQFSAGDVAHLGGKTAAQFNQARMPGARLVKAYNTLAARFQAAASGRTGPDRVVIFLSGDDAEAKAIVGELIDDTGFIAFDVGGLGDAAVMEPPRRPGAVYGEEFHQDTALDFLRRRRPAGGADA